MMTVPSWIYQARFYQFYPLAFAQRDGLQRLKLWLPHVEQLGFNALYLSPVWLSHSHGYDTIDYHQVDPRLGTLLDLKAFVDDAHQRGIRVVLDGVFNHVGRGFFAFQDLLLHRDASAYTDWFLSVNFERNNSQNDGFSYDCWEGHEELVQLNVRNPHVQRYLLEAVDNWVTYLSIDGLRLDAADCVTPDFWRSLRKHCNQYTDFWLMGEIIHGDYRPWLHKDGFHSVTNYELHKGLWSSFNDGNMHEIAYSLNRQFAAGGIYEHKILYNFADNHDVARIASQLHDPRHLFPLHVLLYTVPGIPSVYYGSEWQATGRKDQPNDWHLRPSETELIKLSHTSQDLAQVITRLNALHSRLPQLTNGEYQQLAVESQLLAFKRGQGEHEVFVIINASGNAHVLQSLLPTGHYIDLLNGNETVHTESGTVHANWARVLQRK